MWSHFNIRRGLSTARLRKNECLLLSAQKCESLDRARWISLSSVFSAAFPGCRSQDSFLWPFRFLHQRWMNCKLMRNKVFFSLFFKCRLQCHAAHDWIHFFKYIGCLYIFYILLNKKIYIHELCISNNSNSNKALDLYGTFLGTQSTLHWANNSFSAHPQWWWKDTWVL